MAPWRGCTCHRARHYVIDLAQGIFGVGWIGWWISKWREGVDVKVRRGRWELMSGAGGRWGAVVWWWELGAHPAPSSRSGRPPYPTTGLVRGEYLAPAPRGPAVNKSGEHGQVTFMVS